MTPKIDLENQIFQIFRVSHIIKQIPNQNISTWLDLISTLEKSMYFLLTQRHGAT